MSSYTNISTTRYPLYLENAHHNLLDKVHLYITSNMNTGPEDNRVDIEVDEMFLDIGSVLGNYPALFDMFGKFMAGLDINVLFDQIINDMTDGSIINSLVSNKAITIDNEINNSLARFNNGIEDINSVMSTVYMSGSSLIRNRKEKIISRFRAETRYKLLPIAINRWSMHLSWNRAVINQYAEIIKLYFKTKIDVVNTNIELNSKNLLWPLDLLEFERSIIGLLNRAGSSTTSGKRKSSSGGALGGALSGAAIGASVGGVVGAVVGGVLGLAASFL